MNCTGCYYWRAADGKRKANRILFCQYALITGHCRLEPAGTCTHYTPGYKWREDNEDGGTHMNKYITVTRCST